MTSCLVACMDVSFECMTHGSWAMRRTTPSRLAWEARFLRTLRACIRSLKCKVRCIDFVRHMEPNTHIVHDMVPDGALDSSTYASCPKPADVLVAAVSEFLSERRFHYYSNNGGDLLSAYSESLNHGGPDRLPFSSFLQKKGALIA